MGIPTLIDLLPACVKEPGRISAKIKGYNKDTRIATTD